MNSKFNDKIPLPQPDTIILEKGEMLESTYGQITAARLYTAFWNAGQASYAEKCLDPNFKDNTLPEGREGLPKAPLQASVILLLKKNLMKFS